MRRKLENHDQVWFTEHEITARQTTFSGEKHCLSGHYKFVRKKCPGEGFMN